ncbi:carbohydrate porin [Hydrocarboniphaga sp.]|uniref:carbohydrate porin n=1 Tax=Hydrocarboniphaga sp. TaxID=2033016 RepID=UPI002ABA31D0|nr:carbohydrate porin [Hydrocarboniphaga sp.]MDZ4078714.1 carbohydrate porin [Hydrocarboniphaga sp.]
MSSSRFCRHALAALAFCVPCSAFPGSAFAATLADSLTPKAGYTGEFAVLLDGGEDRGDAYAGQFHVGADLDLARLAGWNGAAVHLNISSRHGDNLATDEIGNSTSVQEIFGGQGERLANLTLEQKLFDDRLVLEGGRTVANIHFLGSDLCSYFQLNAACGNPTFVFRTSSFTWWPVSSWGAHAKAWITPTVYAHLGAYEVNPHQADNGQHGLTWNTKDSTGVILPFALGYKTTPETARLPSMVEFGGWHDRSDYTDPLADANGDPAQSSGLPYAMHDRRSGVYLRFEQQLTRPSVNDDRGLIVFGNALRQVDGEAIEDYFIDLGFVQKGTFRNRPLDSVAFVITQQHYSDEAIDNLRLTRAANGGSGSPHHSQTMMELSYGIQLTPALRIAPNLIYAIHPDQFAEPDRTQDLPNAFIAGLRVDLSLTPALKAAGKQFTRSATKG